jgi:translation initiation factor IF-1
MASDNHRQSTGFVTSPLAALRVRLQNKDGGLRGVHHRARIRATRWLIRSADYVLINNRLRRRDGQL